MNLRDVLELIGVSSIVASLIFVGLQLRQDRLFAQGSQYQGRAEMRVGNLRALLESDITLTAISKIAQDPNSLTPEERRAYFSYQLMNLVTDDNNYYQYRIGLVDEEYWDAAKIRLERRLQDPNARAFYKAAIPIVDQRYAAELSKVIRKIEAEVDDDDA